MSVPTILSAIIVTNRKPAELDGAITNLLNQDRPPEEIIVLDNDPQGSAKQAEHIGDRTIRYLCPGEDLGPVAGRNRAAAAAQGDTLLFMWDFMRFDKYHVANTVMNAMRPREIACLAFQVRDASSHELVPEEYPAQKTARSTEGRAVSLLSNSVFAMRKVAFDELGGFDERLFGGEEGIDLAYRACRAGWQIRYMPDILVNYRMTMRDPAPCPAAYRYLRNRVLIALKHLPFPYVATHALVWGIFSLYMSIREKETAGFTRAVKSFKEEGLWQAAQEYRRANPPSWQFANQLQKREGRVFF